MIYNETVSPRSIPLIDGGDVLKRFFETMQSKVLASYSFDNPSLTESSMDKRRTLKFTINIYMENYISSDRYKYYYGSFDVKFEKVISIENYDKFNWNNKLRFIKFDTMFINYSDTNKKISDKRIYGITLETKRRDFIDKWIKIEAINLKVSNFKINPNLEYNNESGKYLRKKYNPLSIVPIIGKTAKLIKVTGIKDSKDIFSHLGEYEGFDKYGTPDKLRIEGGVYKNSKYIITEIQECSFSHCHLIKEIYIGWLVNRITWNMYQCNSLINIKVDKFNSVYKDIDGVLYKDKELIGFPPGRTGEYIVPDGTIKIGNTAFKSSQISNLILPEGLEEIGCNAFYECMNLKEIVLPLSIKRVCFNNDKGQKPIKQKIYLHDDKLKKRPYSITEIIKMFPEK